MSLELFFKENAEQFKEVEHVVSKRFKDKEGNPIPFKFGLVDTNVDAELKAKCTTKKKVGGKLETDFLALKYQKLFTIASLVYPDLNDAKLQDNYGVMGEEALFDKLLPSAMEQQEASIGASIANGLSESFDELVEEAKN